MTIRTFEIPREAWVDQLNEFTRTHEGWLVSLDVLGLDIGAQAEIVNLPLLGVSADHEDDDGTIAVSAARSVTEHVTRIVHAVTRIYVEHTENGAGAALQIQSADGSITLVRLRAAAAPAAPAK